jgi:hypothetical protein
MGRTLLDLWNEKEATGKVPEVLSKALTAKNPTDKLQERLWGTNKPKTYKEYLANSKPITHNLAPTTALPKYSKGDTPRQRTKRQYIKEKGIIRTHEMPLRKDGTVDVVAYKKLRKEFSDALRRAWTKHSR